MALWPGLLARPFLSLSARRAWIEITYVSLLPRVQVVALRKESVDRNRPRNGKNRHNKVALRKESVDRNFVGFCLGAKAEKSLSARRAWIEISADWLNAGCLPRRSPQGERG